jgi:preprotein translocase subunit YajC
MSFFISDAIADAGAGAAAASQSPDPLASLILPIGLVVLFYFFLIRPQSKRQKEHKQMVADLKKGEEILTSGGILGKVVNIKDDFVTLEIAKDVSFIIQKSAVQTIMPKGTIKDQKGNNQKGNDQKGNDQKGHDQNK